MVRKVAFQGVKWSALGMFSLAISNLLKMMLLARFLDPKDFGLFAIIMIIVGVTALFVDAGMTSVVIHKNNINQKNLSTIFWLNVFLSIVIYTIVYFLKEYISVFYNEPNLRDAIPISLSVILFTALGRIYGALAQKRLEFKFLALTDVFASSTSLLSAYILVSTGWGLYSLVYSFLIQQAIIQLTYFIRGILRDPIIIYFRPDKIKPMIYMAFNQLSGQFLNYLGKDIDILIIGKFFGSETLGGYSLMKQLALRPQQIINPLINKVSAPIMSMHKADLSFLKKSFQELISIISILNLITYLFVALFADYIIKIMYGNAYYEYTLVLRLFCLIMFLKSIQNPIGGLVIALGRTDLELYWNIISFIIYPIVILASSYGGITWVVLNQFFLGVIMIFPFWYILINQTIHIPFIQYLGWLVPSKVALVRMKRYVK